MIRTFTYRGIEARILIDEPAPGGTENIGDWFVEYDLPDGLLQRYVCGWPRPARPIIQVPYTKLLIRPLTGEVLKTETGFFIEPRLVFFYHGPVESTLGIHIALNAVSGLVSSLPEFGGNPNNLDQGHRVLNPDASIRQPVVYDLTIQHEGTDPEGAPASNGYIIVNLVNYDNSGELPLTYQIKQDPATEFGPAQANGNFEGLSQGVYTVRVTDTKGTYRDQKTQILAAEVL